MKELQTKVKQQNNQFLRTEMLFGSEAIQKLKNSTVAVFGIGGVGGHAVEALARSGVGHLVFVDNDVVSISNINRQIIALHSTIGKAKVQVMRERILDINPQAQVDARQCFFLPENSAEFDFSKFSYVVDAVDTVSAKIEIIMKAKQAGVPVISSMGAGNKVDPTKFQVADIFETSVDPLARVMRHELKKRNIDSLKVVYSTEPPRTQSADNVKNAEMKGKSIAPGSNAFVPSVAGLVIAGEVIKDLIF